MTTLAIPLDTAHTPAARINSHVPQKDQEALATSGAISRYHALLNTPYSHPFSGTGYLIGIEKSPRNRSGAPTDGHDAKRLRMPHRVPKAGIERDLDQQRRTFTAVMDDPKVMFVSHILRYGQIPGTAQSTTSLHYSCYSHTAFGPTENAPRLNESYERGWQELVALEHQLQRDIEAAAESGVPFTHLMVMSMGWNNDQFEALERYNAIYQHSTRWAARQGRAFNPLVIGLTWPSVWGAMSARGLGKRLLHVGSYATKSMDADEIGFGLANYIVNAMLPRLEAASGLQSVLIGHSMGARILTRAYYSADLLQEAAKRTGPGPIVIGLQGAFSMNRFRAGMQLLPPFRWFTTGEGAPYQDHDAPGGAMALTWAQKDHANPVARFATGAPHVGGRIGHAVLDRHPDLASKFERMALGSSADLHRVVDMGQTVLKNKKVLYIDATSIIASHSDIRNPHVGELVWRLIEGLGG